MLDHVTITTLIRRDAERRYAQAEQRLGHRTARSERRTARTAKPCAAVAAQAECRAPC